MLYVIGSATVENQHSFKLLAGYTVGLVGLGCLLSVVLWVVVVAALLQASLFAFFPAFVVVFFHPQPTSTIRLPSIII